MIWNNRSKNRMIMVKTSKRDDILYATLKLIVQHDLIFPKRILSNIKTDT